MTASPTLRVNGTRPDSGRAPSLYDLTRPEVIADPWPWYAQLRQRGPILWDPYTGSWLITRHAHITAILADRDDYTGWMDHQTRVGQAPAVMRRVFGYLDRIVAFADTADHARLRRVLAESFSPARIARLDGEVAALVTAALDRVVAAGRMDVVADLAARVPLQVISRLLGCRDVDLDTIRRWSTAFGAIIAAPGHLLIGDDAHLHTDVDELIDHLTGLVARHRTQPRDTVTGALVAAADAGNLDDDEVVANLMMLLAAGNETTANVAANAVAALADEPHLADHLREWPSVLPVAVEELGRLHPANQYSARIARTDHTLHGQRIRAGQSVVLMLACANRDPDAFPDPDALLLDRPAAPRHLGFGHGPHYCFGAALARLEIRHILAGVLARCPDLQADGPRAWRANPNLRGLAALPVTFRPATNH
jgi:pimeloyl-[acyl-carrier protein] synthase